VFLRKRNCGSDEKLRLDSEEEKRKDNSEKGGTAILTRKDILEKYIEVPFWRASAVRAVTDRK
jgi:hypothetical protein